MTRPAATFPGRRAIVAAADPDLVTGLTTALRNAEWRVFPAFDAQAAYELAVHVRADVVVTNSCVGTLEGDILVNALRRLLPHLPILHISAGRARDREVADRIPSNIPSLEEPFSERQLLEAVASILA